MTQDDNPGGAEIGRRVTIEERLNMNINMDLSLLTFRNLFEEPYIQENRMSF